jgi:hypothetical protein
MSDIERDRVAAALRDEFSAWIAGHPNAGVFDWNVAAENVLRAANPPGAVELLREARFYVDARAIHSVKAAKLLDRIDAALPERAMTPEKVEAENERLLNRLKMLYADLAAPGPIDAERQRTLAELAHDAIDRDAEAPE